MSAGGAVRVGPAVQPDDRWDRLAAIYRRERVGLVRMASLLLTDAAAAEEVVQEAFVRLHAHLDTADNPAAYVRTIVVNGCRSRQRHLAVVDRTPQERPATAAEPALPADRDPVWLALQRLPERRRTALVLRFYLDLDDDQIAEAMDARPGTIRSLVSRGLASLAKELAKEVADEHD